uniref:MIP18 family-like domain-containing protein n=1 Tax=Globisporangium ultimum (strain ATCC 200006 / CBS 805.95 / DAOM BR144) TaxID=431595 RepID=K3WKJ9_GLOUD
MAIQEKINANPTVYAVSATASKKYDEFDATTDEETVDPFEADEVFEILRHINDPEHPLTLEQLKVMSLENIHVDDKKGLVKVFFTPTIPHCSMATLIGLCLRVKLLRSLPSRFKVDILITPGTHSSEAAVNKQLNDKERVAAALENSHLLHVVNKCIANTDK